MLVEVALFNFENIQNVIDKEHQHVVRIHNDIVDSFAILLNKWTHVLEKVNLGVQRSLQLMRECSCQHCIEMIKKTGLFISYH